MLDNYFMGTVAQLEKRARLLRGKIPRNLPRDYDTLAQTCRSKLDAYLKRIRALRDDPKFKKSRYQPERVRLLRRAIAEMDMLESVGIAALDRAKEDDHYLNVLLGRITSEIRYPYITPVVTTLSQQYFCTFDDLNLLCVPLLEGQFLLHLPDLYHELAHPLLLVEDDPVIEPLQKAMYKGMRDALTYIDDELAKDYRGRGPQRPAFLLTRWRGLWIRYWLTEFFCDLFAIYTLGPAYAWSHLHLVIKRGGDPFDFTTSSHPADAARMTMMLRALSITVFQEDAKSVRTHWHTLLKSIDVKPEPEFRRCYPDALLEGLAQYAYEGVKDIGSRIATPETKDGIHTLLNEAWAEFWRNPTGFTAWEEEAVKGLQIP
jgi:hypothetical protein